MVALAVGRVKGILKDKEAKHSDVLVASKIVLDRSHPINEPVVSTQTQFIQINVGALPQAMQAIDAINLNKINGLANNPLPQALPDVVDCIPLD